MATRGTYKIDNILVYNHWDNYPEGAAQHLHEIISSEKAIDLFSCIRGKKEFCKATSIFDGPAEFHYIINSTSGIIESYKILENDRLRLIDKQPIEEFINYQIEKLYLKAKKQDKTIFEEGETLENMKIIKTGLNSYNVVKNIQEEVKQDFEKAKAEFNTKNYYYASSLFADTFRKMNKAKIKIDHLVNEYLNKYCNILAEQNGDINNPYFKNLVNI